MSKEYLEALECLKHIKKYYIPEPCSAKTYDCLETIKDTLLKAQQPKQYLKWEDLEFKEEKQTILVLLNGEKSILNYHKTINKTFCYDRCFAQLIKLEVVGSSILIGNSDFFNDLHLERVEE